MKIKSPVSTICLLLSFMLFQSCQSGKGETEQKYDIAAFYWPDYHDEPRLQFIFTDKRGEWQTIYNAKPKDNEERQPRMPLWGYQDESDPKVMMEKINAAVTHGVNVFIFDWYWYDNKPLLESCLDSGFLKANRNRMKFYIMWANHDATSYWDPQDHDKSQVYWTGKVDITNSTPKKFKKYLIKAKQYIDNHPKQPKLITINAWNEWSEGSYLEPDTLYKMGYLDAVKDVFVNSKK